MPIYEYECKTCNFKFEVKRGFGENSDANCPACQSLAQRIFSPVPIVFKGPGFYVTDSAAERNRLRGRKDKDSDKSEESVSESTSAKGSKDEVKV